MSIVQLGQKLEKVVVYPKRTQSQTHHHMFLGTEW